MTNKEDSTSPDSSMIIKKNDECQNLFTQINIDDYQSCNSLSKLKLVQSNHETFNIRFSGSIFKEDIDRNEDSKDKSLMGKNIDTSQINDDKLKDKNDIKSLKQKSKENEEEKLIQELEAFSNNNDKIKNKNKGMLKNYLNKNTNSKNSSIQKSENSFIKETSQMLDKNSNFKNKTKNLLMETI